jgi:transcriptional regulator with GAF, ATPase, and Fis domain
MTTFKTNTEQFIKQRMMAYLREQGFNFYQSAKMLKLTQDERDELSRYWTEEI